jgi:beta-galactosidase
LTDRLGAIKDMGYQYQAIWSANPVVRPKTSTGPAAKVLLTVDHPTITTDLNDVAYVKASIVDATGTLVATASNPVTFTLTGAAGVIKAYDSGIILMNPIMGLAATHGTACAMQSFK